MVTLVGSLYAAPHIVLGISSTAYGFMVQTKASGMCSSRRITTMEESDPPRFGGPERCVEESGYVCRDRWKDERTTLFVVYTYSCLYS